MYNKQIKIFHLLGLVREYFFFKDESSEINKYFCKLILFIKNLYKKTGF